MKKHWWKILGVLILLYVLTVGLLVPLKTGITKVNPQSVTTGQTASFLVTGYNSHFAKATDQRLWLKLDDKQALAATSISVENDQQLTVTFAIPNHLPTNKKVLPVSLIIDNEIDGASVYPSAVFITQDSTFHDSVADNAWATAPIVNLHGPRHMTFPFRNILAETIRNTYFHVPLWFGMIILFLASMIFSVRYLRHFRREDDLKAVALTRVGVLFGILGLITGAIWAKYTWGSFWSWDVKQNMAAIAMLIYLAYFVLRSSMDDMEKEARIAAVYNIFAFAAMIPLLFVIPRLTDSLHPGNGGNPGFGGEDLDNTMRMIFYPAIIGWTLLGVWMANLSFRIERLKEKWYEDTDA